jgi:hypothetical protein
VYLSLRNNSGRIVCSNRKCRIQLLSEFELSSNNNAKGMQKEEGKEGPWEGMTADGKRSRTEAAEARPWRQARENAWKEKGWRWS